MPLYETINLKFSSFWSPHNRRLLSPRIQPIARRYARVTTHRSRRLNRNRTQRRQPEATSQHQTLLCSRGTQPITDCLYLVSTASYSPYTPQHPHELLLSFYLLPRPYRTAPSDTLSPLNHLATHTKPCPCFRLNMNEPVHTIFSIRPTTQHCRHSNRIPRPGGVTQTSLLTHLSAAMYHLLACT